MSKARRIYKDEAGNTLWERNLKGRKQVYAKNRLGKLVNEEGTADMMNRAKYFKPKAMEITNITAISPRGKRIMKRIW